MIWRRNRTVQFVCDTSRVTAGLQRANRILREPFGEEFFRRVTQIEAGHMVDGSRHYDWRRKELAFEFSMGERFVCLLDEFEADMRAAEKR